MRWVCTHSQHHHHSKASSYGDTFTLVIASHCKKSDQEVGIDLLDTMTRGVLAPLFFAHIVLTESNSGGYTTFLRTEFHAAIHSRLSKFPNCHTHASKRLQSYSDSDSGTSPRITLNFADATTATCDILIGADGVKSAVRNVMYEFLALEAEAQADLKTLYTNEKDCRSAEALRSLRAPKWSGVLVYRALVSAEALLVVNRTHPVASKVMQYFGRNQVRCQSGYSSHPAKASLCVFHRVF